MKKIYNTYHPEGFTTMNAYLFIENPEKLIDFLKKAFYAEEINMVYREDGKTIGNCILKIGDTCFMITEAIEPFLGMKTSFYLYVNDVDAIYKNALHHGAASVFPPADMDYGDRQGGVMDVSGNYWWISKRLEEEVY